MAIYLVTGPDGKERLVEAANQASARNHAARTAYTVAVAKQADLFRLAKAGSEVEQAGEEPATPAEQQPQGDGEGSAAMSETEHRKQQKAAGKE